MFFSAGYHLFHCMSEPASKVWLRLDLGGITVGLCGCYFPGVYYAFYCHAVSVFFNTFIFSLKITCSIGSWHIWLC